MISNMTSKVIEVHEEKLIFSERSNMKIQDPESLTILFGGERDKKKEQKYC